MKIEPVLAAGMAADRRALAPVIDAMAVGFATHSCGQTVAVLDAAYERRGKGCDGVG